MKCFDSLRLSLLDLVHDNRGCTRAQLLNLAGGNGLDVSAVLKNLEAGGLLSFSGSVYSLTPSGRECRLALKQQADEAAQRDAQQHADNRVVAERERCNKRQDRLHDFAVSAFSVLFTLLVQFLVGLFQLLQ